MSAMEDYLQLIAKGSPLRAQWEQLAGNISKIVPTTEQLRDPQQLTDFSTGVALNSPMGGTIRPSKIRETLAGLEARGFDTKTPWYHGGPAVISKWKPPAFFAKDKSDAEWFSKESADWEAGYPRGVINKVFLPREGALDVRHDFYKDNPSLIAHLDAAKVKKQLADPENPGYGYKFPEIEEHSPYGSYNNINNTTFIPGFQAYLRGKGYNSLRNMDALDRSELDARIMVNPDMIYNITTKRPSMPRYIKHKIPTSILDKLRK